MVVHLKKSPSADSRTADKSRHITFEEFSKSTDMHRQDVKNMMEALSIMMNKAGELHDWTKKEKEEEFYKEFTDAKENGSDFIHGNWYPYHFTTERHHISSYVHDDINLIDVLEMISDCVCAGMARSGHVYDITIKPEVLMKAFNNTVELVKGKVVMDPDNEE